MGSPRGSVKSQGFRYVEMVCPVHGKTQFEIHRLLVYLKRKSAFVHQERPAKCSACRRERVSAKYRKAASFVAVCPVHGKTEWCTVGRARWCKTCRRKESRERRSGKKADLLQEIGGSCTRCGYDRCVAALDFHHRDPARKKFNISMEKGRTLKELRAEAKKCVVLCANCHRELHAGLWSLEV